MNNIGNMDKTEITNKKLMRPDKVIKILDITLQTFYELVKKNELPAIKIGNQYRVDPDDLEAFLHKKKEPFLIQLSA